MGLDLPYYDAEEGNLGGPEGAWFGGRNGDQWKNEGSHGVVARENRYMEWAPVWALAGDDRVNKHQDIDNFYGNYANSGSTRPQ